MKKWIREFLDAGGAEAMALAPLGPPEQTIISSYQGGDYSFQVRDRTVTVSEEDYELAISGRWLVSTTGKNAYVSRHVAGSGKQGKRELMHRLITGVPPGVFVDHINGDGMDNRRTNLRVCTTAQNIANSRKRDGKRFKGTTVRHDGTYRAQIMAGGKKRNLGHFPSEIEAARAYDAAAIQHFGEFARPNFPEGFHAEVSQAEVGQPEVVQPEARMRKERCHECGGLLPPSAALPPINEAIRIARIRAGLNQSSLARLARLSKSFLNEIECGKSQPSYESLGKIAAACQIKASELCALAEGEAVHA